MIPAGLIDNAAEIFGNDIVFGGQVSRVLPDSIKKTIDSFIDSDTDAFVALTEMVGFCASARRDRFIKCNYSLFDSNPDVLADGSLGEREYVPCEARGTCPHEGKLCKLPAGLSKREVEIVKLNHAGLLRREIADALNLSVNTVPVHFKNILKKTGLQRNVDLVRFAAERNIR